VRLTLIKGRSPGVCHCHTLREVEALHIEPLLRVSLYLQRPSLPLCVRLLLLTQGCVSTYLRVMSAGVGRCHSLHMALLCPLIVTAGPFHAALVTFGALAPPGALLLKHRFPALGVL
jgi:hypothetical protein